MKIWHGHKRYNKLPEKEKQKLVDVFAMTIKITFFSV